jgi:hypothetical protein
MRFGRQVVGDAALLHGFMRLFAGCAAWIALFALSHDRLMFGHAGMSAFGII